jgi:hypothetical protein
VESIAGRRSSNESGGAEDKRNAAIGSERHTAAAGGTQGHWGLAGVPRQERFPGRCIVAVIARNALQCRPIGVDATMQRMQRCDPPRRMGKAQKAEGANAAKWTRGSSSRRAIWGLTAARAVARNPRGEQLGASAANREKTKLVARTTATDFLGKVLRRVR